MILMSLFLKYQVVAMILIIQDRNKKKNLKIAKWKEKNKNNLTNYNFKKYKNQNKINHPEKYQNQDQKT